MRSIAMVAGRNIRGYSRRDTVVGITSPVAQYPDARIGGARMAKYDFVSNWPMEKLAVNGLFEVLGALSGNPGYPQSFARSFAG